MWDETSPDIEEFVVRGKREEPSFIDLLNDVFFLGSREKAPIAGGGATKEAFVGPVPEVAPEIVITGARLASMVSVPAAAAATAIVAAAAAVADVLSDQALEKALERIAPEKKPEKKEETQPEPLETVTVTASKTAPAVQVAPELQTFVVSTSPITSGGGAGTRGPTWTDYAFEEAPPDWLEIGLRQDLGPFGAPTKPQADVSKIVQQALNVVQKALEPIFYPTPDEMVPEFSPDIVQEPGQTTRPKPPVTEEPLPEFVVPGTKPVETPSKPITSPIWEPVPVEIPQPKPEKTPVPDEFAYPLPVAQPAINPGFAPAVGPEPTVAVPAGPASPVKPAQPVIDLTGFNEAMLPFYSGIGAPAEPKEAEACEPPKKKPRTVCYRGYYREFRTSERKVKWERVPCEPRPKKRKR